MQRYLALVIIGAVLLLASGGGLMLFKWKQRQQPSQTSPIIPTVEATPGIAETPGTAETPVAAETPSTPDMPATMPAPEPLHIRGGPTARVTLEEYGDFQCQPCGRLYPVLKIVEQDYGDRLRVIFRHMPLHKHEHALLAARAAEAAGLQGRS